MEPEELLRPRYKVIADYPNSIYKIGEIVQQFGQDFFNTAFFEKYPLIFRKLEWWEEIEEKDMPEYVKWNYDNIPEYGSVEKVMGAELTWTMGIKVNSQVNHVKAEYFLPATKEEYENNCKTLNP